MNNDDADDPQFPNTTANIKGQPQSDNYVDENNSPDPTNIDGEESASGSAPNVGSDDSTTELVKEAIGEEPIPGKPFSLADEIDNFERRRRGIDDTDT